MVSPAFLKDIHHLCVTPTRPPFIHNYIYTLFFSQIQRLSGQTFPIESEISALLCPGASPRGKLLTYNTEYEIEIFEVEHSSTRL